MHCGKAIDCFHLFNSSGARFICKIVLIISSFWDSVTGHLASGSAPISCHIISCIVRSPWHQTGKQCLQQLWLEKKCLSAWCFFNRNKRHITITAQLAGANSFIFRFSLRFSSSSKSLIKKREQKATTLAWEDNECVPSPCY